MEEMSINFTAVLVAVVANFVLGYIWYTPLFGKAWQREMGVDPATAKATGGQMARGLIFMVIGNFLLAYVFAHNIAAWGYVPGMDQSYAGTNIMMSTIFTWLGFYLPGDLSTVAWENKSWKFFGINTGYHFAMLLVASAILTLM